MLLLPLHPPAAHADPVRPPAAESWQAPATARLSSDGSLSDVVAISPSDVWAVGQQSAWDVWQSRSAIVHWNGSGWSEVAVRNDSTGAGLLHSVAAASATELWAVGEGHDGMPYLARGDGSAFERITVDSLHVGDWLGGVAVTPGRVAAVGRRDGHPLIVTGSGGRWKLTQAEGEGALYGVSVSAKGDGWAVGDTGEKPLVMRLSEGTWKAFPVPDIPGGYLRDVHVNGPKRALAVGGVYRGPDEDVPLVLSWNGKKWSRVTVRGGDVRLYGVTGDRKNRFWISGVDLERPGEAFLLRYDGRTLKALHGAAPAAPRTIRLQAAAYVPGTGTVWSVGHVVDDAGRYTDVIERFGAGLPERARS
ncbi:hypothetical protein GCM10010156_12410 [Planobispora rosea]|uniref:Uncharacterized protein n=2 Tax=Planobispora rosea TaxID=35762 RepID=A0A8J3RZD2_PLARO|nr:hypothetical protein GCM10010156_12410 [Planobispora rosea]GIH82842.1 hypothetical protein Pro02_12500 [Planobispora rosea]